MPIEARAGIDHDIAVLHPVLKKDPAVDRGFHKIIVVVAGRAARRHVRFVENPIAVDVAIAGQVRIIAPGPRKDHIARRVDARARILIFVNRVAVFRNRSGHIAPVLVQVEVMHLHAGFDLVVRRDLAGEISRQIEFVDSGPVARTAVAAAAL